MRRNDPESDDTDTASSSQSGGDTSGAEGQGDKNTTEADNTSGEDDRTLLEVKQNKSAVRPKRKHGLTTDMFHQYPFIRLFATGPRNAEQNPHKFYCRLCKKNFSLKTKGIGEIKKHFKSSKHFLLDQAYRAANFLPVLGKDYQEITGTALEQLRADLPPLRAEPTLDAKRPLVGQTVIPIANLSPDSEEVMKCQASLFIDFLSEGAPLNLLPTLWGRFGNISRHPSMCDNFNWSHARVFVSHFYFILSVFLFLFVHSYMLSVFLYRDVPLPDAVPVVRTARDTRSLFRISPPTSQDTSASKMLEWGSFSLHYFILLRPLCQVARWGITSLESIPFLL